MRHHYSDPIPDSCDVPLPACCNQRGDFNDDNSPDIIDVLGTVAYLFQGGSGPICAEEGDVDGNGGAIPIDVLDIIYMVAWLFQGGPAPPNC